jgi:hypothetical protein
VHAKRQVQTAQQQLAIGIVVRRPVPLPIRIEPCQRFEVLALVEIEQHVAIVQIAHDRRRQPAGIPVVR